MDRTKTALVTGIRGQDGSFIAKLLLEKGINVIGCDRRSANSNNWRHQFLNIDGKFPIEYMEITEAHNVDHIIRKYKPDYFFNLAAQSFVATSFDQPFLTTQVNAIGVLNILEAIKEYSPETRLYQASTSELYGKVLEIPQNENTKFNPRSPYGVAKLFAHEMVKNYRESYGMYACSGILFNHESELRGLEFITRKITNGLANVKRGNLGKISLGNIYAKRDWGYAGDYVDAMWRMLNQESPKDYVIATGETHSVKEFVDAAVTFFWGGGAKAKWEGEGVNEKLLLTEKGQAPRVIVDINKEYYRPAEVDLLLGDPTLAKQELGWSPVVKFQDLVQRMCIYDYAGMHR